MYARLAQEVACPIVPVFTTTRQLPGRIVPRVYIVAGQDLWPLTSADAVREAIRKLGQEFEQLLGAA